MGFFLSLNHSHGFHYHLYLSVSHIGQGGWPEEDLTSIEHHLEHHFCVVRVLSTMFIHF